MESRRIRRLRQTRKLLLAKIARIEEFTRGSVVLMKRKCVSPRCRKCASGEGHPTWVLTVSRGGKTHTVYLGEKRLAAARRMTGNYRRRMLLVEEVAQLNLLLLKEHPSPAKGGTDGGKENGPAP